MFFFFFFALFGYDIKALADGPHFDESVGKPETIITLTRYTISYFNSGRGTFGEHSLNSPHESDICPIRSQGQISLSGRECYTMFPNKNQNTVKKSKKCFNYPKIATVWINHTLMGPKDAD